MGRPLAPKQKKSNFASSIAEVGNKDRDLAQLVARYVRDVEVVRSNRIIPTKRQPDDLSLVASFFVRDICRSCVRDAEDTC